jgi:hypothetical protein
MALAIMQFAFPILAGYGLTSLIKEWKEGTAPKNLGKILLGTTGGFLALGLIYAALFKSFYISAMTNSANQSFRSILEQIPDITDFVWGVMIGDWLMIGAILFAFGILSAMLLKNKISLNVYIPVIILLLLLDLWTQGWRPLEITKTDTVAESLQKNDVVEFLQNDKSTFRIADFAMASISPNLPAYYRLENIGGYHPAKLRVYQDMLDVADQGSTNQVTNPFLWNLLNVKYIISPQEMGPQPIFQSRQNGWFVYANPAMFPRAFFVDSIKIADPLTILKNMKEGNFDPSMTAFLESKPKTAIEPAGENATVEIVSRKNEYIKLEVNATGNNLIMLSEIYYPLWKAFIDGNETEILKTNYAFRSIIVPQGKHTIEMKLESKGFATGKMLSIISNILLAVLLAAGLFIEWKKKKE